MILDSTKLRNCAMKAAFRSIAGARLKTAKVKFYQRPLARNCGYTQIVMRHLGLLPLKRVDQSHRVLKQG